MTRQNRYKFKIADEIIARAGRFSAEQLRRDRIRKKRLFSLIADNSSKILDIGCGFGDTAIELALRGNRVLGIDPDKEFINQAEQLAVDFNVNNAVFEREDFLNKDFKGEEFDGIILSEVLEHFDDPLPIFRKIRHLLKNGGWLVISIPNIVSLRNRLVFSLRGAFPDNQEFHRYYFTRADLLSRLADGGFKIEKVVGDFIPFHYGFPGMRISGFLASIFIDLSYTVIVMAIKI
jgi:2-polyprenyl-3-methyl-5-hydroxy-6-metoxy-1,4-benzoquinol methylase